MSTPTKLGLDDLHVGQRFTGPSHVVTAEEIKTYAAQFDPQPFHLDEEAAKGTFFQGLAASGWHTAGITMRLLVDGGLPLKCGVIGGGGELIWQKPVRPGDTLSVETEILTIAPSKSRPGHARADVRVLTKNQHGEVVQSFSPKLVITP